MFYNRGLEQDEKAHSTYHKEKLKINWIQWSDIPEQRVIREYPQEDAFIVLIEHDSVKDTKKKRLLEIIAHVDEQLGFTASKRPETASERVHILEKIVYHYDYCQFLRFPMV
jgi:hypothetical protein